MRQEEHSQAHHLVILVAFGTALSVSPIFIYLPNVLHFHLQLVML